MCISLELEKLAFLNNKIFLRNLFKIYKNTKQKFSEIFNKFQTCFSLYLSSSKCSMCKASNSGVCKTVVLSCNFVSRFFETFASLKLISISGRHSVAGLGEFWKFRFLKQTGYSSSNYFVNVYVHLSILGLCLLTKELSRTFSLKEGTFDTTKTSNITYLTEIQCPIRVKVQLMRTNREKDKNSGLFHLPETESDRNKKKITVKENDLKEIPIIKNTCYKGQQKGT